MMFRFVIIFFTIISFSSVEQLFCSVSGLNSGQDTAKTVKNVKAINVSDHSVDSKKGLVRRGKRYVEPMIGDNLNNQNALLLLYSAIGDYISHSSKI